ncbi:MAG TPA: energy transducer TonB [Spirochaetota bacterium]|nr:energy transducer TonB [Spirochaetota bacterium]
MSNKNKLNKFITNIINNIISRFANFTFHIFKKNLLIFIAAFILNFCIFYAIPIISYFKGITSLGKKKAAAPEIKIMEFRSKPKKKKKRKLKVKKARPRKNKTRRHKSRWKVKLGSGGQGVGIQAGEMKNIVFKANEVDKEARFISGPSPDYPAEAEDAGITGIVDLLLVIDENGNVTSVQAVKEEPQGFGFADAAVNAARGWRFRPAEKNNIPVKMEYLRKVEFK